jgi:hypothetical protein
MSINVITVAPGGQIQEPGAYRCSMTDYHGQKICPGVSISSSGIRTVTKASPHAFWKTSDLNPNRYPPKDPGEGLILGSGAHCLILGDEVFNEKFIYVPEDAPQRPTATQIAAFERDGFWSENARPRAEFWAEFDKRAEGRMLITAEQVQKITYMAENLAASPVAVEALTSQLTEISMIWQDEQTGLWIKSRPDCMPSNGYDFGDLKTFAPKGGDLVLAAQRAITDMAYAQQMALAVEGAERVLGTTASTAMLVFVQTSEPYEVVPIQIDEEALYWARVLNRDAIDKIARGLATGEWPMRAVEPVPYSYPPSLLDRFGQMQIDGRLPSMERTR